MSPNAEEHVFQRLDLSPVERVRARELAEPDFRILNGVKAGALCTSPALAQAAGLTVDQVNVSIAKLARLGLLTLHGSEWAIMEDAR